MATLTPTSSTWYQLQPGETIDAYNSRIAAANPNLPAPGTTSSTGVTNNATSGSQLIARPVVQPTASPAPTTSYSAPSTTPSSSGSTQLTWYGQTVGAYPTNTTTAQIQENGGKLVGSNGGLNVYLMPNGQYYQQNGAGGNQASLLTSSPVPAASVSKPPVTTTPQPPQTTPQTSQPSQGSQPAASNINNYGLTPTSPHWYWLQPGETIDNYNARIAAANPNLPAPGTTSSTGITNNAPTGAAADQNYAWQPNDTAASYSARIDAYNASNPTTNPTGDVGNSGTMASATGQDNGTGQANDPYAGLDPVAKQVKMYTDAYNALGLSTIKQQFDSYTKQLGDIQNELNDKKQANQNNPWMSQGLVDKRNQQLDTQYQTKIDTLTHLLTLTDSLYKSGQAQVDTLVSNANADIKAINDLAQKQIDAANAIAKDNVIQSIGGYEWLVNKTTGAKIANLGPVTQSNSGTSLADKEALAAFEASLKTTQPRTPPTTPDITNYNMLRSQGYTGSYQQYLADKSSPLGFPEPSPDATPSSTQYPLSLYDQASSGIDWASLGL